MEYLLWLVIAICAGALYIITLITLGLKGVKLNLFHKSMVVGFVEILHPELRSEKWDQLAKRYQKDTGPFEK